MELRITTIIGPGSASKRAGVMGQSGTTTIRSILTWCLTRNSLNPKRPMIAPL